LTFRLPNDLESAGCVDRAARDAVGRLIRRFLDRDLTAFAFDEAITPYGDSSDRVIQCVVGACWYYYDDMTDHYAQLTRKQWDFFQRMLLLLASDWTHVDTVERRRHWSQVVAGLTLIGGLISIPWIGLNVGLILVLIPLGIVAALLHKVRTSLLPGDPRTMSITSPFASIAELWGVYATVKGFRKAHFPWHLAAKPRTVRPWYRRHFDLIECSAFSIFWCVIAPAALVVQMFPVRQRRLVLVPGVPMFNSAGPFPPTQTLKLTRGYRNRTGIGGRAEAGFRARTYSKRVTASAARPLSG